MSDFPIYEKKKNGSSVNEQNNKIHLDESMQISPKRGRRPGNGHE